MTIKIESPIKGFSEKSVIGSLSLEFKDGVATTEEKLNDGMKAYLKRRGYKVSGKETEQAPQDGPFDPSKHKAEDVLDYASTFEVSPEEITRVLDAEKSGKNRKGVTEGLQARLDEIAEVDDKTAGDPPADPDAAAALDAALNGEEDD